MAVSFSNVIQPGLLSQQYPPPLLPKPGKDNARLQKLLKKSAKKKASTQATQSTATFRSSLSPVNEASPDLEHSDNSTPPRTPETPLYGVTQPSRYTVRPLYQHVPSPYPKRAAFGGNARFTPQMVAATSPLSSQSVVPTPSIPVMTISAVQVTIVTPSSPVEIHVGINPAVGRTSMKPQSLIPTFKETQTLIRPLTVLAPLMKPKSPRPNFKATETSKSPKPMFDVPQIRMYTANTSYYETSRTPPVYDTAGLTSIGSTLPRSKTPTLETKRDTPTPELNRAFIPRSERPENLIDRVVTPTGHTPLLALDPKTSILETRKSTTEMDRVTPTSESKRATPTTEIKRAKTPTYDISISRTPSGRPKTPSYHVNRAKTPVFEISRPNPLLFAVSPTTVDSERSTPTKASTPYIVVDTQSVKPEPKPNMTTSKCTGDIHSDITEVAAKSIQEYEQLKSESSQEEVSAPVLTVVKIPTATLGYQMPKAPSLEQAKEMEMPYSYQRPKTPSYETQAPVSAVTPSYSYQKPKTATNEGSKLVTTGYQRPKTPTTYGTAPAGLTPVGFQRPKTPTTVTPKPKSSYRGLTPAEYVAYGGIQSYSPAFGISRSKSPVPEEVKLIKEVSAEGKTSTQESLVKTVALAEVSKTEESPPKEGGKPCMPDEEVFTSSTMLPTIVVSQASNVSETTLTSQGTNEGAKKPENETPKVKCPAVDKPTDETSEKEMVTPVITVLKLKSTTTEAIPISKDDSKVYSTAIAGHVIKDKAKAAEQATATKIQIDSSAQPSGTTTSTRPTEVSVPSKPVLPNKKTANLTGKLNETKQEKAIPTPAVESSPENKESDPAAHLKASQKPKGLKSKLSGWSRLKKHMVVEQEEPKFPDLGSQKEGTEQSQSETKTDKESVIEMSGDQDVKPSADAPKATQMWDAVLFQMFSSKENIMHQIELNKCEDKKEVKDEPNEIPAFAHRLPVLLFCPKFDAKKLREAASRPVTKIATVFEMGLIGRKNKDEEPKDFNRTARGFAAS